ncbi:hypothetical protein RRG08_006165 [Elysia crispata]|uniref:Uncharacterized protein n=1 Tax=Elysia crispata TaxID=231223 RepID=A0AAE1AZ23_9GAST|nr:hypothetical protein RRG08_006165 [Elysia crispata]
MAVEKKKKRSKNERRKLLKTNGSTDRIPSWWGLTVSWQTKQRDHHSRALITCRKPWTREGRAGSDNLAAAMEDEGESSASPDANSDANLLELEDPLRELSLNLNVYCADCPVPGVAAVAVVAQYKTLSELQTKPSHLNTKAICGQGPVRPAVSGFPHAEPSRSGRCDKCQVTPSGWHGHGH